MRSSGVLVFAQRRRAEFSPLRQLVGQADLFEVLHVNAALVLVVRVLLDLVHQAVGDVDGREHLGGPVQAMRRPMVEADRLDHGLGQPRNASR